LRTLAHLSDIHFDRVDRPVAEALIRDLAENRPDVVVISGDLTQRARFSQFCQAVAYLKNLPTPQIVLAGNHDVPLFNPFRRLFAPLGRFKRLVTPEMMPVYQDEELLMIGLNTAGRGSLRPGGFWKDGRIESAQLNRALAILRAAPAGVAKVIVTHHPFVAHNEARRGDTVRNGAGVIDAFNGLGVNLLLAGHLHHAYHAEVACGAISVQAGSACSTRRRGQPNSYNRITIDRDVITVQVRIFENGTFRAADENQFARATPLVK